MKKTLFTTAALLIISLNAFSQGPPWQPSGQNIVHTSRNVGINTSTPAYSLDVDGIIRSSILSGGSGLVQYDSNGALLQLPFSQSLQDVLRGDGSWGSYSDGHWQLSGNDLYSIPSGNVGIGIIPTIYKLDVAGNVHVGGSLFADEMLVSGKITGGRIETDTVSTGRMMVDTSVRVANSIFIDGINDRIWASSGQIDFMSTDLTTTGTITAGGLNVSFTTFDSLNVLNRIVTSRISSPDGVVAFGDSTISINHVTNSISSNTNSVDFVGSIGPPPYPIPGPNLYSLLGIKLIQKPGPVVLSHWQLISKMNNSLDFKNPLTNKTVMTLVEDGNIGIGTTAPTEQLHIAGAAPSMRFEDNVIQPGTSKLTEFRIRVDNGTARLISNDNLKIFIDADDNSSTDAFFVCHNSGFIGGNVEMLFKVQENGNVSIGVPYPAYKLDVAGYIRACDILVEQNNFCDYVFGKDYALKPLEEVEDFTMRYKHFKGVPTADEIAKGGLQVGEMLTLNFQKTEEAYRYLFLMNRKLKEKDKQVKELQAKVDDYGKRLAELEKKLAIDN